MKKQYRFFAIISVVYFAAAAVLFAIFAGRLPVLADLIGAGTILAAWGYALLRFVSLRYELSDGELIIRSGIFLRVEKRVKSSAILSESYLTFGGIILCSRITIPSGSITLFCDPRSLNVRGGGK